MPSKDLLRNTVKHRACDECRSRKLACSKEPGGCSRCIQESVKCHYSEQKPMGRPRKRQCNGGPKEPEAQVNGYLPQHEPLPYFDENLLIDPQFEHGSQPTIYSGDGFSIPMGDRLSGDMPFTAATAWEFEDQDLSISTNFRNEDFLSGSLNDFLTDSISGNNAALEHQHQHALNKSTCGCLAGMYLAMASLQEFPTDITSGLTTVRAASNMAQTVLRCPHCGIFALSDLHPPIEVFQNTMLLGTILPTIVNGYKKLLAMVDCEANIAGIAGNLKTFQLKDYGNAYDMGELRRHFIHLENIPLDPQDWRLAIRRLFMIDLYGHENISTGLKGIIAEMDTRQRARHLEVDRLKAQGLLAASEERLCVNEKDALCLRILDTARIALDGFVVV